MALIIALVLILILGCTRLFDNRDKIQFETRMTRKKQWVESVTDDDLERKLTFGLTDTPEVYESELKDAYEEIERKYTQSIQAVYNSFINDAASRGEDKREYWKKEMLIDRTSPKFNQRLMTNVNKVRILLAKRGYLRREDAQAGSYMNLGYNNPVEGVVLAWCADELQRCGRAGIFLSTEEKYSDHPQRVSFKLSYAALRSVGWNIE